MTKSHAEPNRYRNKPIAVCAQGHPLIGGEVFLRASDPPLAQLHKGHLCRDSSDPPPRGSRPPARRPAPSRRCVPPETPPAPRTTTEPPAERRRCLPCTLDHGRRPCANRIERRPEAATEARGSNLRGPATLAKSNDRDFNLCRRKGGPHARRHRLGRECVVCAAVAAERPLGPGRPEGPSGRYDTARPLLIGPMVASPMQIVERP